MTLKLIQWKARELQARTRRRLLATATGPVAAGFLYAFSVKVFPPLPWLVHLLFGGAVLWSLAGVYVVSRSIRSAGMASDAGASTSLAFCREEIGRTRLLQARQLLWSFAPMLLAVVSVLVALLSVAGARETRAKGLPFSLLVLVWMVAYCVIRAHEQRSLERELAELEEIGKAG